MTRIAVPGTTIRLPRSPSRKQRTQELLLDDDTFATTLLVLAADVLGTEGFAWHPTTIRREVEEHYNVQLPGAVFDKLMAAITIVTTDQFYNNLPAFVRLCDVLSGSEFNPTSAVVADALECAWGITEAVLLDPPETEQPFSELIRRYVGAMLDAEGYDFTPKVLSFVVREEKDRDLYRYSDDPEFFSAVHQNQQQQADELDAAIESLLGELVEELSTTPLENGNAKDLAKKLRQGLQD